LQLWRTESEDAFISIIDSQPRFYFDGFTDIEEEALVRELRTRGLSVAVT
jgi:hypothetical protein